MQSWRQKTAPQEVHGWSAVPLELALGRFSTAWVEPNVIVIGRLGSMLAIVHVAVGSRRPQNCPFRSNWAFLVWRMTPKGRCAVMGRLVEVGVAQSW